MSSSKFPKFFHLMNGGKYVKEISFEKYQDYIWGYDGSPRKVVMIHRTWMVFNHQKHTSLKVTTFELEKLLEAQKN